MSASNQSPQHLQINCIPRPPLLILPVLRFQNQLVLDRPEEFLRQIAATLELPSAKLGAKTPKFVVESDATIVAPLIFAYVLNQ